METPQGTGALGVSYKQLSGRFCTGKDLQGKIKKSLRPRVKLLFVPGRTRRLPNRCDAGSDRKLEF